MEAERRTMILRNFALVNVVAAVGGAALLLALSSRIGAALALDGVLIAIVLALGAVVAWILARARRPALSAVAAIAIAMVAVVVLGERARSEAAARVSYRALARAIAPELDRGCALASYRHFVQSIPFYSGHRELFVEYWGELAEFPRTPEERAGFIGKAEKFRALWSSPGCVVLIANRKDLPALMTSLSPVPEVLACEGKKLALSNRPGSGVQPHPPPCGP
jgi:Aminoarabinose transferase C-terminal domain